MDCCSLCQKLLLLTVVVVSAGELVDNADPGNDGIVELQVDPSLEDRKPVYKRPVPCGPTYFCEPFDTRAEFLRRWVYSQARKDDTVEHLAKYDGKWTIDEPLHSPIEGDLGLVLKSRAKHHAISAKLEKPFEFIGKPLIVQYEVKFQAGLDCGGAYIKLLSKTDDMNLKFFTDKTPYTIMFGPDKCGNDHKLHFIFRHRNPRTGVFEEKHAEKPTVKIDDYFVDRKTHLFTLIVNPDNTYQLKIDNRVVAAGDLLNNFSPPVTPPTEIDDPEDLKPDHWDNREKIPDPQAQKPDDWDELEPETVEDEMAIMPLGWLEDEPPDLPDPDVSMPSDWNVEVDGQWEPPLIDNPRCKRAAGCGKWRRPLVANPKYKGVWRAPEIDNPNYSGEWKPRKILNPDYYEDLYPFNMTPIGAVGLELWSMTDNILFDNFIISDNATIVEKFTAITWMVKNTQERRESSLLGLWGALKNSARDRPWLWVIYSFVLVLPVLLLFICFCPRPGAARTRDYGWRKKFDYPMPDVVDVALKKTDAVADKRDSRTGHSLLAVTEGETMPDLNMSESGSIGFSEYEEQEESELREKRSTEVPSWSSGSPRKRATRKE